MRLKSVPTAAKPRPRRFIDHERALALYRRGASDPDIGRACGVVRRAAKAWRDRHGLAPNRAQGGAAGVRALSPSDKAEVLRSLGAGASACALAKRYGVTWGAIDWHRRQAGLR